MNESMKSLEMNCTLSSDSDMGNDIKMTNTEIINKISAWKMFEILSCKFLPFMVHAQVHLVLSDLRCKGPSLFYNQQKKITICTITEV